MKNYNEVLEVFKGNEELREWLNKPFYIGEIAMATDSYSMCIVDKNLTDGFIETDYKNKDKLMSIIPKDVNVNKPISKDVLLIAINSAPLVDETKLVGKDVECSECLGEGYVEWEYKNHTKEHECPECNGDGQSERSRFIPTGKKIMDNNACVKINYSFFRVGLLKKLLSVCDILNIDEVVLLNMTDKYKGSLFQIGEAKIVLMPMGNTELLEFVYEITTAPHP